MATLMHVRVKRRNETIFLMAEPSDSFGRLRTKLHKIVGVPAAQIRLLGPDQVRVMEDEALLSDHGIKDNGVVYMVLQTESGGWEEVALQSMTEASEEPEGK